MLLSEVLTLEVLTICRKLFKIVVKTVIYTNFRNVFYQMY